MYRVTLSFTLYMYVSSSIISSWLKLDWISLYFDFQSSPFASYLCLCNFPYKFSSANTVIFNNSFGSRFNFENFHLDPVDRRSLPKASFVTPCREASVSWGEPSDALLHRSCHFSFGKPAFQSKLTHPKQYKIGLTNTSNSFGYCLNLCM